MAIERVRINLTPESPWKPIITEVVAEAMGLSIEDRQNPGVMNDLLAPNDFTYYGFIEDKHEIGFGAVKPVRYRDQLHLKLHHLGVVLEYRNQGLGGQLVGDFVQIARLSGASALRVYPTKTTADFYKKCGFVRWREVDREDLFKPVRKPRSR